MRQNIRAAKRSEVKNVISVKMLIVALILFGIIFMCAAQTVSSKGKAIDAEELAYYHCLEQEYIQKARTVMDECGYRNGGITMTHCIDAEGEIYYTVRIHHARLESASAQRKADLEQALNSIDFEDGQVLYEII